MKKHDYKLTLYTSEDRERLVKIKRMFDMAHQLCEAGDMAGYANMLADIVPEWAVIERDFSKKYDVQKTSKMIRQNRDRRWLEAKEEGMSRCIYHLEREMRIAFETEMMGLSHLFDDDHK